MILLSTIFLATIALGSKEPTIEVHLAEFTKGCEKIEGTGNDSENDLGQPTVRVTRHTTVEELIDRVNFSGLESQEDLTLVKDRSDVEIADRKNDQWRDDGGAFLLAVTNDREMHNNPERNFKYAYYGGKQLSPKSTLFSNGIRDKSLVLLRREPSLVEDDVEDDRITMKHKVYFQDNLNKVEADAALTFFKGESMWNMYIKAGLHFGRARGTYIMNIGKNWQSETNYMAIQSTKTKRWRLMSWSKYNDRYIWGNPVNELTVEPDEKVLNMYAAMNVGYYADQGMLSDRYKVLIQWNPFEWNTCDCYDAHFYNKLVVPHLNRKQVIDEWGSSCKAHDNVKSYCKNPTKRAKGNRDCWCPLKWCYTSKECGSPSKTNPGTFYTYDICDNEGENECYTRDDEGSIEEFNLGDVDIFSFPRLQNYLNEFHRAVQDFATDVKDLLPKLQTRFLPDD